MSAIFRGNKSAIDSNNLKNLKLKKFHNSISGMVCCIFYYVIGETVLFRYNIAFLSIFNMVRYGQRLFKLGHILRRSVIVWLGIVPKNSTHTYKFVPHLTLYVISFYQFIAIQMYFEFKFEFISAKQFIDFHHDSYVLPLVK